MVSSSLRRPIVTAMLAAALVVGMAACAGGQGSSRHELSWSSLDDAQQRAAITAAERRLDSLLASSVGLDEYLGVDAEEAGRRLPASLQAATASGPGGGGGTGRASIIRMDDSGATAAASNGLSILDDLVRDGLGKASESDDSVASGRGADGASPQFDWEVSGGEIAGTFSEMISSNTEGASLTMSVDGEFLIQACPDPDGATTGEFFVGAEVELDSTDPRIVAVSAYEMGATLNGKVDDGAFMTELEMNVHGNLGDAQSSPGASGAVGTTGSHVSASADLSFTFGQRGASGGAVPKVSGAKSSTVGTAGEADAEEFAATQQELAEMIGQRISQLAEDYWRDGNCVFVVTDPAEKSSLQPGATQQLEALPYSRIDDSAIDFGTVEGEKSGPGSFTPAGKQKVHTTFEYAAPDDPGALATVEFTATSRRGIGRASLDLEVVDGWVLDQTFEEVRTTAVKCDGLFGAWTLDHTAPWAYQATTTFTMDESLSASYQVSGVVDGQGFGGTGEVTLVEVEDGAWELHASTGENVFALLLAPPGTCD